MAVPCFPLAPIGNPSGGGHGSSWLFSGMSGMLLPDGRGAVGWFESPADFFSSSSVSGCVFGNGGFADE